VPQTRFDLKAALADIRRKLQELHSLVPIEDVLILKFNATQRRYTRACDRVTDLANRSVKMGDDLERATRTRDRFFKRLAARWEPITSFSAPSIRLIADLEVHLSRLPVKKAWQDLRQAIVEIPLVQFHGRVPPLDLRGFQQDLVTLDLRLAELQDLAASIKLGAKARLALGSEQNKELRSKREALFEKYKELTQRSVKDLCAAADVDRAEFGRWRRGEHPAHSAVTIRIEREIHNAFENY
jgi:hypothetical protein